MNPESPKTETTKSKRRMSTGQRLLFFLTAWLICLMPFLFWWNTWFGRQLPDQQLAEYLNDEKKPRHIQHALVQIGERMGKRDLSVTRWYPDLIRLASHHVEEVRNTDAWVMGQDTSGSGFHEALLKMLTDSSPLVRGNAALSLVRFGDSSGRMEIVRLLQPAIVNAPQAGAITDNSTIGMAIHQNGVIAKLKTRDQIVEIRSPISGRLRTLSVQTGKNVSAGEEIATVAPATDQAWEALRALYLIGQLEDLPAVLPYERELPDISDHVRQQAVETEKAIKERSKH
jgi:HlyD family secretion protein/HEAT repeat